MVKIVITLVVSFIVIVPFLATPIGEEIYSSYQETKVYKSIYCQYVEWFGTEGYGKIKFFLKCKLP